LPIFPENCRPTLIVQHINGCFAGAIAQSFTHFLEGIAPLGDDMVMVLDLARLMADEPIELAA
jgi:hypothetical protein